MGLKPLLIQWEIHKEANEWTQKCRDLIGQAGPTSPPALVPEAAIALPSRLHQDTVLTQTQSCYLVMEETVLEKGVTLSVEAGVEIQFGNSGRLISFGQVRVHGSPARPVRLRPLSPACEWAGLFLGGDDGSNRLEHVELEGARYGIKSVRANVHLSHCTFRNIREAFSGEKSHSSLDRCLVVFTNYAAKGNVNLIKFWKGRAAVRHCTVYCPPTNLKIDAFDVDHVEEALFQANRVYGVTCEGADGIDVGLGSQKVLIVDNLIANFIDKGISVGESAQVTASNNVIVNCGMGVGIKDQGTAEITHVTFYQNKVGVACYEKVPGQGGGYATASRCVFVRSHETDVLCEAGSSLDVSYSVSDRSVINGHGNGRATARLADPDGEDFAILSVTGADGATATLGTSKTPSGTTPCGAYWPPQSWPSKEEQERNE